jgi:signal transduction histidine kinase
MIRPAELLNRISTRIAVAIVLVLLLMHAALGLLFVLGRDGVPRPHAHPGELATLLRLVDSAPPSERAQLVEWLGRAFPSYDLTLTRSGSVVFGPPARDLVPLPLTFATSILEHGAGDGMRLAVRLPDGETVTARLEPPPPRPFGPLMIVVVSTAACATALGLWAARSLTAPLQAFAQAAEAYRPEGEIAPLPERGPEEIRAAAAALNALRERIKILVEDRTRLLAAVGHDLRTPITRMRLRCDFIEDENLRVAMVGDLAQMHAMAESILSHLRVGHCGRDMTRVDFASLVQTVCDEFADLGHPVSYQGPAHAIINADADVLRRALANLVDNAVRYGGGAVARLQHGAAGVTLDIADHGPGIPDDRKAAMLEPFVRGDAARSMDDTAGFGLGLSIARAAIAAHGGTLTLLNNAPQGLVVRIVLPVGEGAASTRRPDQVVPGRAPVG